jgi:hypothetical protein
MSIEQIEYRSRCGSASLEPAPYFIQGPNQI